MWAVSICMCQCESVPEVGSPSVSRIRMEAVPLVDVDWSCPLLLELQRLCPWLKERPNIVVSLWGTTFLLLFMCSNSPPLSLISFTKDLAFSRFSSVALRSSRFHKLTSPVKGDQSKVVIPHPDHLKSSAANVSKEWQHIWKLFFSLLKLHTFTTYGQVF